MFYSQIAETKLEFALSESFFGAPIESSCSLGVIKNLLPNFCRKFSFIFHTKSTGIGSAGVIESLSGARRLLAALLFWQQMRQGSTHVHGTAIAIDEPCHVPS